MKVKNASEMQAILKKFQKETIEDYLRVFKKAGFKMHSELAILTPKDTGHASQHWSISTKTNENESVTIDSLNDLKLGDKIFCFNNVPYIKKLDEGWSLQRPSGFTHLAYQSIKNFLEAELKKLNKKE